MRQGEAASKGSQLRAHRPKVHHVSLFLPIFPSLCSCSWSPSPDWPVQYSGSWVDECGGKERDWRESDCHTVIGTKTWRVPCLPLASFSSVVLSLSQCCCTFALSLTSLCFAGLCVMILDCSPLLITVY